MMRSITLLLAAGVVPLCGNLRADDAAKAQFFEKKIRPVLVKQCYECHSAKSDEIKGNLRVDSKAGLLDGGDSGPSVVPGKPEESLLIEALKYDSFEMPPAGRLKDAVIADFEKWIEDGAYDPRKEVAAVAPQKKPRVIDLEKGREFWAFQPLSAEQPSEIADAKWPKTDIDRYVLARLEEAELLPAPDADRRTLLRRVYFDLIGLPPTPADVEAFLEDREDGALERVVDRLLSSEQFGVHWGRHWLDVARYADSNGGDFNATFHNAWKYRDYVFRAYNEDKPFDQFVGEQIAGDLLPADNPATKKEQIVATGFLMLGAKMLSERDKMKLTMDVIDEQINTVGQAFLGMTLGCARCHDHKFDPIPTADYYALAGIFQSTETLKGESQQYVSTWPRRTLPTSKEHAAQFKTYEANQKKLKSAIAEAKKAEASLSKALAKLKAGEQVLTMDDADAKKTGVWKASTYSKPYVGAGYVHDDLSEKGRKFIEYTIPVPRAAEYDVQLSYTASSGRASDVPVSIQHATGEQEVTLNQKKRPPIDNLFASVGRFRFDKKQPAVITIATRGTEGHVIADAVRLIELDDKGQPAVVKTEADNPKILATQTQLDAAKTKRESLEKQLKDLAANAPPPLPQAIAVTEAPKVADCEICIRGEHQNRGPIAKRGVLQVATWGHPPEFPADESGRRQLADWIADSQNPLTARVYVNRVWQHLLGSGIVASVDNFGQLGNRPTHPELLDYLAKTFIAEGWSTKKLIRQIVLSRVYQQSSDHNEIAWNADPENLLLWRANRRRLPAEAIRDSMLSLGGNLDLSPAGSPVEGLGTLVTQNNAEQSKFERKTSSYRSAYLPIIRAEIPPILLVFDFADPDLVTGRRSVTNVPAQALLLLNSPFVMTQAEQTADRIRKMDSPHDEIERAYRLVLSRPPTTAEHTRAKSFLDATPKTAKTDPLAQFLHTMFASTEFRMLN